MDIYIYIYICTYKGVSVVVAAVGRPLFRLLTFHPVGFHRECAHAYLFYSAREDFATP